MITAYFDCFSGISGDMTLGALAALGVPTALLEERLQGLPLSGFTIHADPVSVAGIQAVRMQVHAGEGHHHRHYTDICALIENSPLSAGVKTRSLAIFDCLAEAESRIHGCAKEKVHFHEVGAVDAIVDIVGTCLGLEYLSIEKIIASALPMGSGFVTCAHGVLPVPAPATLEILKGAPVYGDGRIGELVTPTGAAILTGLAAEFGALPPMQVSQVGYGAGTRETTGPPNLLRVILGTARQQTQAPTTEQLAMVDTCIDDMNPEIFGYLMETLFKEGALDVFWVPVQMKKNRPGIWVQVLCPPERRARVMELIFAETTTLGVRFHEVQRACLARRTVTVNSVFGAIQMKEVSGADGTLRLIPEYEICRQIAREKHLPLQQVYETLRCTAQRNAPEAESSL